MVTSDFDWAPVTIRETRIPPTPARRAPDAPRPARPLELDWLGDMFPGGIHRAVHELQPWGIVLTLVGVVIALITIMVDLEDRQSERIFRAWQVVRGFETQEVQSDTPVGASGSSNT